MANNDRTGYIGCLDQGTTSTRFIVLDDTGSVVAAAQAEHKQIFPQPGWVEHDPLEILEKTNRVIGSALGKAGLVASDLTGVGITNQRETAVVWDRRTGLPVANAIVWQDTRTDQLCRELGGHEGTDRFRARTGLPLATYFAGPKIRWLLDRHNLHSQAESGKLAAGTVDTWLLWNLTGGTDGGRHLTDVTNASRTMLMDINTRTWDPDICAEMGIPLALLSEIRSSSEVYGTGTGVLSGVSIAGILGDQHAALFGQTAFDPGQAKNTYGTGCFLLLNTGANPVASKRGLLTTLGYQLGEQEPVYALEGSIAIAGALVQWLRDNLGLIENAAEIETLAAQVEDSGDTYLVPAFSGLFAPHWRPDARGVLVGLTRYVTKSHLARAALEAVAFQTQEVLAAMEADAGVALSELRVDGGMVQNQLLMQFQSDLLGVDVVRPEMTETTALGAGYAAGLAVGVWEDTDSLRGHWQEDRRWQPAMDPDEREQKLQRWSQAVQRSLNWV